MKERERDERDERETQGGTDSGRRITLCDTLKHGTVFNSIPFSCLIYILMIFHLLEFSLFLQRQ